MSGTHQFFTVTGRALPPPPTRAPARSSSVLRLPTRRYDPLLDVGGTAGGGEGAPVVARRSLEHPRGGEFTYKSELARRASQLIPYDPSHGYGEGGDPHHSYDTRPPRNHSQRGLSDGPASSTGVDNDTDALTDATDLARGRWTHDRHDGLSSSRPARGRNGRPEGGAPPHSGSGSDSEDEEPSLHFDKRAGGGDPRVRAATSPHEPSARGPGGRGSPTATTNAALDARRRRRPIQALSTTAPTHSPPPAKPTPAPSQRTGAGGQRRGPASGTPADPPLKQLSPELLGLSEGGGHPLPLSDDPPLPARPHRPRRSLPHPATYQPFAEAEKANTPGGRREVGLPTPRYSHSPRASATRRESNSHRAINAGQAPALESIPAKVRRLSASPERAAHGERGAGEGRGGARGGLHRPPSPTRHSRCPSHWIASVGGTELLPAFPLLQGQATVAEEEQERSYRTMVRFMEWQPDEQRRELKRLYVDQYQGRETEFVALLSEAYAEDFEAMKAAALDGGSGDGGERPPARVSAGAVAAVSHKLNLHGHVDDRLRGQRGE